jgi:NADPH:quinone reductase-like Zn-dependent oxidoreductase
MKAIRIHSFGGPEVLRYEDVPIPTPQEGEILVRVHAAGVNPADWKTRAGSGGAKRLRGQMPVTLGWDVSGVVEALGGAAPFGVGDAVHGFVRFPDAGATYAQYAALPAAHLAPKPRSLDHLEAASVPLAGLTAWQALFDVACLEPGQTILVHAAAGGVGHLAVQLARWRGATVTGTASARNEAFLREIGCDRVIDYRATRFEELVHEVDVVLDPSGGVTRQRSWRALARGGLLVGLVDRASMEAPPAFALQAQVRGCYMLAHPDGAQLAEIGRLIDKGHMRPNVDRIFRLSEAAEAHRYGELGHTRGKIVLQVKGEDVL